MDIGLLLLRLLLAAVLFAHATQKVFGWFQGPGLKGAEALFDKLGQQPAQAKVRVAVCCELAAALLLGLGLATPLGAATAAGTMLVAGAAMALLNRTLWNAAGGGEYPFVLAAAAACLGFTGAGRYSLDAVLDFWPAAAGGPLAGAAVIVVALVAAVPPVVATRRAQARRTVTP